MSISKVEIYLFHSFDTQSMIACGLNALILGKGQFFKEDFITSKMLKLVHKCHQINKTPPFIFIWLLIWSHTF